MPAAGSGFEEVRDAQAMVAAGSLLVAGHDVVQAANVTACAEAQLEPLIAPGRDEHHHPP